MALTPRQWAARIAARALHDRCLADPELGARRRQWSQRGGQAVLARYGRAHYMRLARLAAQARARKGGGRGRRAQDDRGAAKQGRGAATTRSPAPNTGGTP